MASSPITASMPRCCATIASSPDALVPARRGQGSPLRRRPLPRARHGADGARARRPRCPDLLRSPDLMAPIEFKYRPAGTVLRDFMLADDFFRGLRGPVGS